MATEVKNVTDPITPTAGTTEARTDRTQQFWNKNSKYIVYGFAAIVLLIGGYIVYQNYVKGPEEAKASEAMWRAEEYYRADSIRLALNGVVHLNLILPVPVIFGILTVDTQRQAEERIGGQHGHKGEEAAITAIKMIALQHSFRK